MSGIELFVLGHPVLVYALIFVLMFFEGEGIILLSSLFAWQGHLNWLLLAAAIVGGSIVGDICWYAMGKYLKETRLGIWLDARYEKSGGLMEKVITEHYGRFAIISKFLYFTAHPTVFLVGWHDYPFKRFLWINIRAVLIWSAVILGAGYFFGYAISLIGFKKILKRIEIVAAIVFLIVIFGERLLKRYFVRRIKRRNEA